MTWHDVCRRCHFPQTYRWGYRWNRGRWERCIHQRQETLHPPAPGDAAVSDTVLEAEVREWRSLHQLAVKELAMAKDVNRVLRMENNALRARIARLEDQK